MAQPVARTWGFLVVLALLMAGARPAPAQEPAESAAQAVPAATTDQVRYGVGLRLPRWVSVPGWFLDAFFAESVPLSTFQSYGAEFIRRKPGFDIVVGLSYQNMSPGDGNWLGRGKAASLDTDFVQFRGLSLVGLDAAFVGRRSFNSYLGLRYGAGLGVALVRGQLLRTSSDNCTSANAGDERVCRPRVCPATGCTEAQLASTERAGAGVDGPDSPSRFSEPAVPSVLPIVNLSLGLDFRLPSVPGVEARVEGGFYDAFFLGLGVNYIF
jgi:hypothetical protein